MMQPPQPRHPDRFPQASSLRRLSKLTLHGHRPQLFHLHIARFFLGTNLQAPLPLTPASEKNPSRISSE
jgi:hypothetical protein